MLLAILLIVTSAIAAPAVASAAEPGPKMVFPVNGATLRTEGSYLFKVVPVPRSTGYLYGFFQDGKPVWENWSHEHVLSGPEYAMPVGSAAHAAVQPGKLQLWVRALVDANWTDATIVDLQVASAAQPVPGGGPPVFYCIIGPGGTCPGVPGEPVPPTVITWNNYLEYLDALGDGLPTAFDAIECARNPIQKLGLDCFSGYLESQNRPVLDALATVLGAAGCVVGAKTGGLSTNAVVEAVRGCVSTAAFGLKVVVFAVRAVAAVNLDFRKFLETRMI